ncbi:DUF3824 domain-containing protein [Aspergillus mulundensis]|uniref:DUF3824 domain-containing protein n=1 Tax=Aspergillus mulundensis TaxID=1810919 RepID=A0A3D8SX48_9EURO|nr:Uncharacterized protein DSM5745_02614 [Aspergillus mulundensis]RDW90839.1 Uncharacterized protein DSM5745_02614 [Aspergillus mulundensis]
MSSNIYRERDREDDWDERRSGVSIKRYVIPTEERERERDLFFREESGPGERDRELVIRRTTEREEPIMVQRYERDTDYDRDYYERELSVSDRPRRNPNPITIREDQPVIIQEARGPVYINSRESDYDIVHRSEVDRDPAYYYHRRVREYDNDSRRMRRELSPSDSVSQASRRRDDDYSSDDSMVYIRKETKEYDDHHHRHLASGALVGVGAAEFLRSRRKKDGEEVAGGLGRIGRDVGAGALGAAAVEAASRAKEYYRSKSRHRSHSFDDDRSSRYSHHRHYSHSHSRHRRSRSRSHSRSRARTFAEIGLGAAAIAGAVALARKKSNSGRSRSRSRRSRSVKGDDAKRSQSHRRKHMAEAGLAGATVAGLVERARSRSRSKRRSRSRSKSKIRKALPVVAAGLGSAVAANIWDKKKDKEAEEEPRRKSRHRSRSRGRAPSDIYPDPTRDSTGLIEYGDHPVHGSIPAANYYGRPPSSQGYHTDASDRLARDAGLGSRHRGRTRSRSRARFSSSSPSSDEGRRRRRSRHRHRSRSRDLAGAALAATGVGYAAHKYAQHRKEDRDRERQRYDSDGPSPFEQPFSPSPYPPSPATGPVDSSQYRPNNYYPPPPGSAPTPAPGPMPYNPADYPPPPNSGPPPQQYSYPPPAADAYAPRPRRADENVSATRDFSSPTTQPQPYDGLDPTRLTTPRPRPRRRRTRAGSEPPQSKSVAFDDDPQTNEKNNGYETDDSDSTIDGMSSGRRRRRRHHRRHRSDRRRYSSSDPYASTNDRTAAPKQNQTGAPESDSDATVDLPDRFDRQGRLLPQPGDDPLADKVENLLRRFNRVFV